MEYHEDFIQGISNLYQKGEANKRDIGELIKTLSSEKPVKEKLKSIMIDYDIRRFMKGYKNFLIVENYFTKEDNTLTIDFEINSYASFNPNHVDEIMLKLMELKEEYKIEIKVLFMITGKV